MEKNTVYVVVDGHSLLPARSVMLTMVGCDDKGKFFLPLNNDMLKPENCIKVDPSKFIDENMLGLPDEYRFKLIYRRKLEPNGKQPLLSLFFTRWFAISPMHYGNDIMTMNYRVKVGEKYSVPISDLFISRIYVKDMLESKIPCITLSGDTDISVMYDLDH